MGEHQVKSTLDTLTRTQFIHHLLDDIQALDIMLEKGMIESDIIRIGAEQEFCLVDEHWRPAKKAEAILSSIKDAHFTTELAQYNLEINLDPVPLSGNCFSKIEQQLNNLLSKAEEEAQKNNAKIILTGILPTISKAEVELEYMSPNPRYFALNKILKESKGKDFELHLQGVNELSISHDSVLFEACNTSFQMHLQIAPKDFAASYNWAQAISGPLLGICTNSPLLLGRELWSETRIGLFQQSLDTRNSTHAVKDQEARVSFGNDWVTGSISDFYKNEIARHKVILAKELENDSLDELKKGNVPKLKALNVHNGTIYKWNRPCYGVGEGKAHIRIENRYVPAGPTSMDEMANFAFWVGLMVGRPEKYNDLPAIMDFQEASSNFMKAARTGKESLMQWFGSLISIEDLILNELLPIAKKGLEKCNIDRQDIERLLKIIEQRATGMTGSQWMIKNHRSLLKKMNRNETMVALTKAMHQHQVNKQPVHTWNMIGEIEKGHDADTLVEHIMSTHLFSVNENDLASLATHIMEWENIHHVPVENNKGEVCGLLTWNLLKQFREEAINENNKTVADIMIKRPAVIGPQRKITDAIKLMKEQNLGCLLVVQEKQLLGILSLKDVIKFEHDESP